MTFLKLAARNVSRNRRRSAITASAIILGVVVTVLLKGMADGFTAMVVESVVHGRTAALQVQRAGYFQAREGLPLHLSMPQTQALEQRILKVEGVKALAPGLQFAGLVTDGVSQSNFLGTGIVVERERGACPNWGKDLVPGGSDFAPDDHAQALLGVALADSFQKLDPGGRLTLSAAGPTGRMNALEVVVKGATETLFRFDNKRSLVVPLSLAQELLGLEGHVTAYAIAIHRLKDLDRVASDLRRALGPEYEVHTWREIQPYMYGVVRRQEAIVAIAAFIFALAVVTGIANAMASSVLERSQEVGTMLALGLRRSQVLRLFLLEAMLLGAAAGIVGAVLARLVVAVTALVGLRLRQIVTPGEVVIRPEVSLEFIALMVLASGVVAVVASVLPAWKTARLHPADALRS